MSERSKGSVCPSGPRWAWKHRPQMPRGSERERPEASPWGQHSGIRDSSDLRPRTQGPGPRARPTPPHRQTGRPRRSCSCEASSPLLPGCSAPAEVPGQEGKRCENGGTGCPDKTEGTLQREKQNNQENMPEVTSRAQGTKKESGRNRANSEKPGREPIP